MADNEMNVLDSIKKIQGSICHALIKPPDAKTIGPNDSLLPN